MSEGLSVGHDGGARSKGAGLRRRRDYRTPGGVLAQMKPASVQNSPEIELIRPFFNGSAPPRRRGVDLVRGRADAGLISLVGRPLRRTTPANHRCCPGAGCGSNSLFALPALRMRLDLQVGDHRKIHVLDRGARDASASELIRPAAAMPFAAGALCMLPCPQDQVARGGYPAALVDRRLDRGGCRFSDLRDVRLQDVVRRLWSCSRV